jgi:hypothetical protein
LCTTSKRSESRTIKMALIPAAAAGSFALNAGRYVAAAGVTALANRVAKEVDNFSWDSVNNALARLAPGKRNKAKRKAVRAQLTNGGGGRRNGNRPSILRNVTDAPRARNFAISNVAPRFRSAVGKYSIENREYVRDVEGSTSFALSSLTLQPGTGEAFPWLSRIANSHQKYRFTRLKFTFIPVVGTDAVGRIVMAYAVDPLDTTPGNKFELYQYPTSVEGSVWSALDLVVDCNKGPLFVRAGTVVGSDLKTYDFGKLFIATSATSSAIQGSIFVDYAVELITPKPAACPASWCILSNVVTATGDIGPFQDSSFTGASSTSYAEVHGGPWYVAAADTLATCAGSVVFLKPGTYFIRVVYSGTSDVGTLASSGSSTVEIVSSSTLATSATAVYHATLAVSTAGEHFSWTSSSATDVAGAAVFLSEGTSTSQTVPAP